MNIDKCDDDHLAKALKLVGDKWSILVLHHLKLNGPMRFKDCQEADGMSSRTLANRLSSLEQAGLIKRKEYHEYPPRTEYQLTKKGQALTPAVEAIAEWSRAYL